MRRRSGLAAVWLTATVAATLVVWLAIRIVADDVSDPETAAAASDATTSTTAAASASGETTSSTSAAAGPRDHVGTTAGFVTTTVPGSPSTTARPTSTTTARAVTTTSTSTVSSTTSTTTPPTSTTRTFNGVGGSVTIRFSTNSVELVLATPADGFTTKVDDSGPDRVRVEFRSNDHTTRIEANAGDTSAQVTESGSGQG